MEEYVGRQWDRLIRRMAERAAGSWHADAAVYLPQVERAIGLLFRAGGGAPAVRIAPASPARSGGPRGWLQRIAGADARAARGRLDSEALALPPVIGVHASRALNRALYFWLAAQAALIESTGDWIGDNLRASAGALAAFPGLAGAYRRLLAAERALRPDLAQLRGAAVQAERWVQQALAGDAPSNPCGIRADSVAPVWMWLDLADAAPPAQRTPQVPAPPGKPNRPSAQDDRRRRARRVDQERDRAPLLMLFRAESLLSWDDFMRANRAEDDDDDGNALAAANDMEELAIAPGGASIASRVKFDLDLPSAAADDRPLGPGVRLPEWDWRRQALIPDYCAAQILVTADPPPFSPPPALRAAARRVRRRMEALREGLGRLHAQPDGEDIDLDAYVRYRVEAAGASHRELPPVFTRHVKSERSLATLLLADLSLSTDAYLTPDTRVIDVIRDALYVFGEALAASGDPFEMLGFSSARRHHVRIHRIKGFGEPWDAAAKRRAGAVKPGFYTRMGAAIRMATQRLQARPERQRLLLILTDGKPNDMDVYEGRYGLEDTRHAVRAARAEGLMPLCITIDDRAHNYLPMLFGRNGYLLVHRPQDLAQRLAGLHARFVRAAWQ
ncbi:MAG: VWA domain-containing protein [Burkholderiaceae bacterium]|jgi:nitric oxide reductase NorD protein|nr:VWA domain-containing protein [Burkholderiaceae bacterium]